MNQDSDEQAIWKRRIYWERLCALQPYSFVLFGDPPGVVRAPDSTGNWLERHKVQEIVDAAQVEIDELRRRLADERKQVAQECIDLVYMHGGSVETEAALRAIGGLNE
jgi:hypothetical protein